LLATLVLPRHVLSEAEGWSVCKYVTALPCFIATRVPLK
jgi:hypothetical protein